MVETVHQQLKGLLRAIFFLPTISSSVAVAIMWGYIFHPQAGLLNTLIKAIGLAPPKSWLTDPSAIYLGIPLAMIAVIIAYLWQDFGYNLVIFIAALQGIPQEIQDAARVDGANPWQMFWRITLPLLRPIPLTYMALHKYTTVSQPSKPKRGWQWTRRAVSCSGHWIMMRRASYRLSMQSIKQFTARKGQKKLKLLLKKFLITSY